MQNLQPIVDGILATDPPRVIDAVTSGIKQAIMDDLSMNDATAAPIATAFATLLETQARNTAL